MFTKLFGLLKRKKTANGRVQRTPESKFTGNIKKDEQLLRDVFRDCSDVKYKRLNIPALNMRQALLVEVQGLVSHEAADRDILSKLLAPQERQVKDIRELISIGEIDNANCVEEMAGSVLVGKVGILVDKVPQMYLLETKEWPTRGIEEPIQERLIRGPREGFTEVIQINLGLVRRRIPDPSLKILVCEVGRRSKTKVAVLYIEDVCNLETVQEIKERIKAIDIDGLLDPGALTELITERTISPFPLLLSTERPDKVAGGLLQGKVAIISDGSPFALLAPVTYFDFFQIPEDYYMHPLFAFVGRLFRAAGIFIGTTLVAAFVAVITFHYEIIPADIVVFIAETREGVPFTPLTEAFLLEFTVEILREASIRLPGPIGPTLSIVGALILGQAAVAARLVSPVLLIIVAMSFISGSIVPNYEANLVTRWIRFPILLMAGFL